MAEPAIELIGIDKRFGAVRANRDISLTVEKGTIHGIIGENGAGKSTLMKVLSGVYPAGSYDGEIHYDGALTEMRDIADSEARGIIIIHQELALVPLLSIAENLFLGNENARGGVIDWRDTNRRTEALLRKVGLRDAPTTQVEKLGVGKQQLVEIAKALAKEVRLLILDEPTSALSESDSQKLLDLMLELKAQGMTQIIISHKLNEVRRVADSVTVIRDGQSVSSFDTSDGITEDRIVRDMVGRSMENRYPERTPEIGERIMRVADWSVYPPEHDDRQVIKDVGFDVRAGEVVGIAGLMGAGRTELAMSIFGRSWGQNISGTVEMHGQPADVSDVSRAIAAGLAYVPEDRKSLGLILDDSITRNITISNLPDVARGPVLNEHAEKRVAEKYRGDLGIRTPGVFQKVVNLSGGNQQKVVLSKWLFAGPEVLILDEPTRGIDVGAKYEIYGLINDLAAAGKGVVMISSEMPELLGMCDRIYVMNEGAFVGEMPASDASQERIMSLIVNN